jgi:hypothetical protein
LKDLLAIGGKNLKRDFEFMINRPITFFWNVSWSYVTIIVLLVSDFAIYCEYIFQLRYLIGGYILDCRAVGFLWDAIGWNYKLSLSNLVDGDWVVFLPISFSCSACYRYKGGGSRD